MPCGVAVAPREKFRVLANVASSNNLSRPSRAHQSGGFVEGGDLPATISAAISNVHKLQHKLTETHFTVRVRLLCFFFSFFFHLLEEFSQNFWCPSTAASVQGLSKATMNERPASSSLPQSPALVDGGGGDAVGGSTAHFDDLRELIFSKNGVCRADVISTPTRHPRQLLLVVVSPTSIRPPAHSPCN